MTLPPAAPDPWQEPRPDAQGQPPLPAPAIGSRATGPAGPPSPRVRAYVSALRVSAWVSPVLAVIGAAAAYLIVDVDQGPTGNDPWWELNYLLWPVWWVLIAGSLWVVCAVNGTVAAARLLRGDGGERLALLQVPLVLLAAWLSYALGIGRAAAEGSASSSAVAVSAWASVLAVALPVVVLLLPRSDRGR